MWDKAPRKLLRKTFCSEFGLYAVLDKSFIVTFHPLKYTVRTSDFPLFSA